MFRHSSHNDMHILVGNHDIGFHSMYVQCSGFFSVWNFRLSSKDCGKVRIPSRQRLLSIQVNDLFVPLLH